MSAEILTGKLAAHLTELKALRADGIQCGWKQRDVEDEVRAIRVYLMFDFFPYSFDQECALPIHHRATRSVGLLRRDVHQQGILCR